MPRSIIIVASLVTFSALSPTFAVAQQTPQDVSLPAPHSAQLLAIQTLLAEKRIDDAETAAWKYWKESDKSNTKNGRDEARIALARVADVLWQTPTQTIADKLNLYFRIQAIEKQLDRPEQIISTLQAIGYTYYNLSQNDESIAYYKEIIALSEKKKLPLQATYFHIIGLNYERKNDYKTAITYYQKSLQIAIKENNKPMEDFCYNGLGNAYSGAGRYEEAIANLEKSMAIRKERKDEYHVVVSLNNIGRVYRNAGQLDKAKYYFEQSLAGIQEQRITDGGEGFTGWVLNGLGDVAKRQGRLQDAEDYCERSVAQWEVKLKEVNSLSQGKMAYLSSKSECYQNYLDVLLRRAEKDNDSEKIEKAFALMQTMKARALTERMQREKGTVPLPLSPQQHTEEKELREKCSQLTSALLAESVKNEVGSKARYESIKAELAQAERNLGNLLDRFYAQNPQNASRRATRGVAASDIAAVLPADAVLVDYIRLKTGAPNHVQNPESPETDTFIVFTMRGNRQGKVNLSVQRISGSPDAIAKKAEALHRTCTKPTGDWTPEAKELYSLLVPELHSGTKQLIVCPDGGLWDTPFAVLLDKNNDPLLKHQQVGYAYSANMWLQTFRQRDEQQKQGDRNIAIVALADPEFAADKQQYGNVGGLAGQRGFSTPDRDAILSNGKRVSRLPGTRAEAEAIAKSFPDTVTLTGLNATETNLRKSLVGARYLHIATHGFFNDAAPLLSSLVLAEPAQVTLADDGLLTAREIIDLNLSRTEMTVLSACSTGRGEDKNGEGMVGLTWSLFAAGCPAQVVSQWAVNDTATATLMTQFYTELKAGKSKGDSLREAALTLAHNPRTSHPYYWASFVLFGDAR